MWPDRSSPACVNDADAGAGPCSRGPRTRPPLHAQSRRWSPRRKGLTRRAGSAAGRASLRSAETTRETERWLKNVSSARLQRPTYREEVWSPCFKVEGDCSRPPRVRNRRQHAGRGGIAKPRAFQQTQTRLGPLSGPALTSPVRALQSGRRARLGRGSTRQTGRRPSGPNLVVRLRLRADAALLAVRPRRCWRSEPDKALFTVPAQSARTGRSDAT